MKQADEGSEAAAAPCCDSADFIKVVYNCFFHVTSKSKTVLDNEETYIVGSGKYSGESTTQWANDATKRLLYYSYRNRFIPLINGATTDTCWGCMIRSGQMMLAYAYMRFYNNGNSRIDVELLQELRSKAQILFADIPSAPFSIHAVSTEGVHHGVACGKWFGPTPVANTLSSLSMKYLESGGEGPVVISVPDRQISAKLVKELLQQSKHVVLLIPAMLGIGVISEKYAKLLTRCLELESSIGILGGARQSAFFLFGHQGNDVFYLDPHYIQSAFTSTETQGELTGMRKVLPVTQYDTSMAFGFYISSLESFLVFEKDMIEVNASLSFPLISITSVDKEVPNIDDVDDCTFTSIE